MLACLNIWLPIVWLKDTVSVRLQDWLPYCLTVWLLDCLTAWLTVWLPAEMPTDVVMWTLRNVFRNQSPLTFLVLCSKWNIRYPCYCTVCEISGILVLYSKVQNSEISGILYDRRHALLVVTTNSAVRLSIFFAANILNLLIICRTHLLIVFVCKHLCKHCTLYNVHMRRTQMQKQSDHVIFKYTGKSRSLLPLLPCTWTCFLVWGKKDSPS